MRSHLHCWLAQAANQELRHQRLVAMRTRRSDRICNGRERPLAALRDDGVLKQLAHDLCVETLQYKNIEFNCWDIGGQHKLRSLW